MRTLETPKLRPTADTWNLTSVEAHRREIHDHPLHGALVKGVGIGVLAEHRNNIIVRQEVQIIVQRVVSPEDQAKYWLKNLNFMEFLLVN